jgi:hypothetical protein
MISRAHFSNLYAKGGFQTSQVVHEAPEGPHIYLVIEGLLPEHLGTDVNRRAYFGNLQLSPVNSPRYAHVADFNYIIGHDKDILWLDVPVDNQLRVEVAQALGDFPGNVPDFILRHKIIPFFVFLN